MVDLFFGEITHRFAAFHRFGLCDDVSVEQHLFQKSRLSRSAVADNGDISQFFGGKSHIPLLCRIGLSARCSSTIYFQSDGSKSQAIF